MSTHPSSIPTQGGSREVIGEEKRTPGADLTAEGRPHCDQQSQMSAVRAITQRVGELEYLLRALKDDLSIFLARPIPEIQGDPTTAQIVMGVCRAWGVNERDLYRADRSHRFTEPRRAVQYLMREHLCMSFPQVARIFSQHHTSVMHGLKVFRDFIEQDSELRRKVRNVETGLGLPETIQ